ncbi:MAG: (2Fe-2S) ferredoxin domain-containing protein [Clostridiaceae bacterium]
MRISICVGSSCHLKGSREVVERLERLIGQYGLNGRVELTGTFCMGRCQNGVSVMVEDMAYSVLPETAAEFFASVVLPTLRRQP